MTAAGEYKGKTSSVYGGYVKLLYLEVDMKAGADWTLKTKEDETLLVYIIEGEELRQAFEELEKGTFIKK